MLKLILKLYYEYKLKKAKKVLGKIKAASTSLNSIGLRAVSAAEEKKLSAEVSSYQYKLLKLEFYKITRRQ